MLGHFLRRDFRDFLLWWAGIVVITIGFVLASLVLPWQRGLPVLFWAYMMFAWFTPNQVLGSVWRTQHGWSRHYLLSLPVSHKRLFVIQNARMVVFWVPLIVLCSVTPALGDWGARGFSRLEWGLYYFGLLTSVVLLIQDNVWTTLQMERIASYVPKGQRLRAWASVLVVTWGFVGLLGVAWVDLVSPTDLVSRSRIFGPFGVLSWAGASRIVFPGCFVLAILWARWNARRWCVTL